MRSFEERSQTIVLRLKTSDAGEGRFGEKGHGRLFKW